jgi:UDP-N-acetylglucosamine diphosphorylase / glucose-1-phosphate thymidylyltransferase / UDP-N-acetylgalactosamine diphosphorylase / glucosamine-1-phosphate N-acetyltransferase / galactosamine-1-phosphate N-acetyltransferase
MIGLIPAAGRGVRAYPYTQNTPKCMLRLAGKPILEHNIRRLVAELGVKKLYIVLGDHAEVVMEYFGKGASYGLDIEYLHNDKIHLGMAYSVYLARDHIREPFVAALSDEMYLDSEFDPLRSFDWNDSLAVCCLTRTERINAIRKNYTVEIDGDLITRIIEKPQHVTDHIQGCGTYLLKPEIFDLIGKAYRREIEVPFDFMTILGHAAQNGSRVRPFFIGGHYVNINTKDDLNLANYLMRDRTFEQARKSVVIPALNEESLIGRVVRAYKTSPHVDEVIVVSTGSTDRTGEIAAGEGARVVDSGALDLAYGAKVKAGLDAAAGDILIVTEADDCYTARDIPKFLAYLRDADMVVGTRTTKQLIEQASNMRGLLRWGNILMGKVVGTAYAAYGPRFTDVGCMYRALWKYTYQEIRDQLSAPGQEFAVEMLVELLRARRRIIEVPVSYYARQGGESSRHKTLFSNMRVAGRMLQEIAKGYRLSDSIPTDLRRPR